MTQPGSHLPLNYEFNFYGEEWHYKQVGAFPTDLITEDYHLQASWYLWWQSIGAKVILSLLKWGFFFDDNKNTQPYRMSDIFSSDTLFDVSIWIILPILFSYLRIEKYLPIYCE